MEETLQPKMKKEKLFKWALWWGLGIVVVCIAIIIIKNASSEEFESPMMNVLYDKMYKFGILPLVIFMGIIGPVYEEFAFRLWGNGKLWTGILSTILMAVVTYIYLRWWWFSLLVIMCGAFIIYYFRNDKKKKLFYLMLLSSAAFAIAHKGNYSGDWFKVFIDVFHKFGMGLLASYLVINYNLFWAMVLHAANNSILAILFFFAFNSINGEVKVIENEDFRLKMRTVLVKDMDLEPNKYYYVNDTSTYFFGAASVFAQQVMFRDVWQQGVNPDIDTLFFRTNYNELPYCFFNLVFKTEPYNYHRLLKTLEEKGLIKLDTTYIPAYHMYIADQSKLVYGQNDTLITYKRMLETIRRNSCLPVYSENTILKYNGRELSDSLYIKGVYYRNIYTIEELQEILEPQGIVIEPSDRTMTIINIKNTYNPLKDL